MVEEAKRRFMMKLVYGFPLFFFLSRMFCGSSNTFDGAFNTAYIRYSYLGYWSIDECIRYALMEVKGQPMAKKSWEE